MRILSLHIGALGIDGGVAQVATMVLDAFAGLHGGEPWKVDAFSLLGERRCATPEHWSGAISYRAFEGDRLAFSLAAMRVALRARPDLIFVDHLNLAPVAHAASIATGAPVALFLHGIEVYGAEAVPGRVPPLPLPRRLMLRRARLLCANSHWTARLALEAAPGSEPAVVCSLAPSRQRLTLREAPSETATALMVGRISRSERYKGHREVLDSWPRVLEAVPNARLRIIGGGDDLPSLRARVAALGLSSSVEVAGRVSDAVLEDDYRDATVFVLPSRGEGFGLVYAEAALAGLPSIAHAEGPAEEIIGACNGGWLVDGQSTEQLATALVEALARPEETLRRGRRAQEYVSSNLTTEAFARTLRDACLRAGSQSNDSAVAGSVRGEG